MPDGGNPLRWNPRPRRFGPWRRVALWLALLAVVGVGVVALARLFPGRASSDLNVAFIIRLFAILAFVSSGLLFARRIKLGEFARNLAIWLAVAAVLLLGFAYQDQIRDAAARVRAELVPGYAASGGAPGVLVVTRSRDGHFHVIGKANGTRIEFLVDTGASDIVLSPADARRLGIDVASLDFTRRYATANGSVWGAPYRLASLTIGDIRLSDVPVSINRADMAKSLLGMSFLKSVDSFEIQGRKLYLRWKD